MATLPFLLLYTCDLHLSNSLHSTNSLYRYPYLFHTASNKHVPTCLIQVKVSYLPFETFGAFQKIELPCWHFWAPIDRKSTRLTSSHVSTLCARLYTLSLHDALPISIYLRFTSFQFTTFHQFFI